MQKGVRRVADEKRVRAIGAVCSGGGARFSSGFIQAGALGRPFVAREQGRRKNTCHAQCCAPPTVFEAKKSAVTDQVTALLLLSVRIVAPDRKGPRRCRSAITLNLGSRWSPSRNRQALPLGNAHRFTNGLEATSPKGIGSESAMAVLEHRRD
jgi:hypothetical protein